jgi:hypothetical protein
MEAKYTVAHLKYSGSTDADGYPTGDNYAAAVNRPAYGIEPLSSRLNPSGEYDRRVLTSKVVGVPDVSPYSPRDKVILPGSEPVEERTYWVSQDVRDFSTGPFGGRPASDATRFGEIVIEIVTG